MKARPLLDGGQGKHHCPNDAHHGSHARISSAAAPPTLLSSPTNIGDHTVPGAPGGGGTSTIKKVYIQRRTSTELQHTGGIPPSVAHEFDQGLKPPSLNSAAAVTGATKARLRVENKCRRKHLQKTQAQPDWWTTHKGCFTLPPELPAPTTYRNQMCPRRLALHHPAATIQQYYFNMRQMGALPIPARHGQSTKCRQLLLGDLTFRH